jgi:hypothetical protein
MTKMGEKMTEKQKDGMAHFITFIGTIGICFLIAYLKVNL